MTASDCRPTHAAIDLSACVFNLRRVRERVGRREIWPVLKADGYGHGAVPVGRALAREQVGGFCVATVSEGRELRRAGVVQPILVMAGAVPGGNLDPFATAIEYGLALAVPDASTAERLASAARSAGVGPASVHLKVDTGMGRIGLSLEQAPAVAAAVAAEAVLSLDGIFSNLATADSYEAGDAGVALARDQAAAFRALCDTLEAQGDLPRVRSLANSAAICHHPDAWDHGAFTAVRPGLALYGATLTPGRPVIETRPAMRLVTTIAAVRRMPEGATVGYGIETVLRRPSRLAVLALGYHDGLPRNLAGDILVRGRRAPLIGRISMDISLVDVTDVTSAAPGDPVVIFGRAADVDTGDRGAPYASSLATAVGAVAPVSGVARARQTPDVLLAPNVEEIAERVGTIPHEILCRVGPRVPRVYPNADAERRR